MENMNKFNFSEMHNFNGMAANKTYCRNVNNANPWEDYIEEIIPPNVIVSQEKSNFDLARREKLQQECTLPSSMMNSWKTLLNKFPEYTPYRNSSTYPGPQLDTLRRELRENPETNNLMPPNMSQMDYETITRSNMKGLPLKTCVVFDCQKEKRPFTKVRVNKYVIWALIDSGSQTSLLHTSSLKYAEISSLQPTSVKGLLKERVYIF